MNQVFTKFDLSPVAPFGALHDTLKCLSTPLAIKKSLIRSLFSLPVLMHFESQKARIHH